MLETPVHDPMAKFNLVTSPPLPAYCAACRKDADGKQEFVDLTASIDYYGAILLCRNCAEEIARTLLGFVDPGSVAEVSDIYAALAQDVTELKEKNNALESVILAYGLGAKLPTTPGTNSDDSVPDEVEESDDTDDDYGTDDSEKTESRFA